MTNSTKSTGPSFLTLLALVFITLKLIGEISWSWWWVLAPLWIPTAVAVTVMAAIGVGVLIVGLVAWAFGR